MTNTPLTGRLRIVIRGAVQGVGFRPFVYRLAMELKLKGWVINSSQGVFIEVEGNRPTLDGFLVRLQSEKPPRSFIQSFESSFLDPVGYTSFEVRQSEESGPKTALVMADIATCPDCLNEIFDPTNRRYRYPFTNCTNCGPRYSIIESLPYDRPNTSMKIFPMCPACRDEYDNPADRRFHAQPNACPECGPHLELWNSRGKVLAKDDDALIKACESIIAGKIAAIKGLGGFHLMLDARNPEAVNRLRRLKNREEKPFALMYPSLELAISDCRISEQEKRLLLSPESPIVLLAKNTNQDSSGTANNAAPNNPYLGVMLPYTPLHHLLMRRLGFPIVATSGNLTDEPICIDEHEAISRLGNIAEIFLIHNRPIVRHVDDSIIRLMMERELVLRRARGYAPLPITLKQPLPKILAVGAHLKNTVAVSVEKNIFVSQHIGDLETTQAYEAFTGVIKSLSNLYDFTPGTIACDIHPEYISTKYAEKSDIPVAHVQHHYAHILSCMAENELEPPALGVSWDGTGYGEDGTIWGGEFLRITGKSFERVAHLRQFRLPGGDKAVKEPRRIALGLLYELYGDRLFNMPGLVSIEAFTDNEKDVLKTMLNKKLNCPLTSSAGRLFDSVSSIIGLRQHTNYEGQAAMELEFALIDSPSNNLYPFQVLQTQIPAIIDWEPMIKSIIDDCAKQIDNSEISAKFHNTLAEMIIEIAKTCGETKVVLSGGCFQNKYLTEKTITRLTEAGFRPYWHQRIPPNDGGIALGQIVAASRLP